MAQVTAESAFEVFQREFPAFLASQGGWFHTAYLGTDYPTENQRWPPGKMQKWITSCPGVHISLRYSQYKGELMEAIVLDDFEEEEEKEEGKEEEERCFPEKAFCEYLVTCGYDQEGFERGFVQSAFVSFISLYEAVEGLKEQPLDECILWFQGLDYVEVCAYFNGGHADCIRVNPHRLRARLKMQPWSPRPEECRSLPPWRQDCPETALKRRPFRPSSLETSRRKRSHLDGSTAGVRR